MAQQFLYAPEAARGKNGGLGVVVHGVVFPPIFRSRTRNGKSSTEVTRSPVPDSGMGTSCGIDGSPTVRPRAAERDTFRRRRDHEARRRTQAEGAGFEPAVRVNGLRFSRPVH